MTLVDADYEFIWLVVGPDGAASDAHIHTECDLKKVLLNKTIGFPDLEPLPGDNRNTDVFPQRWFPIWSL